MSADTSTEWRLAIWQALLPQVPKYLLLGKGYSFSAQTFNESMGLGATFKNNIDAADNPLALSSDFHSGPLSLVIPFGIWGVLVWLWYMAAGFYVRLAQLSLWRPGAPAHQSIFVRWVYRLTFQLYLHLWRCGGRRGPLCGKLWLEPGPESRGHGPPVVPQANAGHAPETSRWPPGFCRPAPLSSVVGTLKRKAEIGKAESRNYEWTIERGI